MNVKNKKFSKLKIIILIFSSYCLWNIISLHFEIINKKHELEQIIVKYEIQKSEYADMQDSTNEYIRRICRKKLNFVDPNERVFVDISKK